MTYAIKIHYPTGYASFTREKGRTPEAALKAVEDRFGDCRHIAGTGDYMGQITFSVVDMNDPIQAGMVKYYWKGFTFIDDGTSEKDIEYMLKRYGRITKRAK